MITSGAPLCFRTFIVRLKVSIQHDRQKIRIIWLQTVVGEPRSLISASIPQTPPGIIMPPADGSGTGVMMDPIEYTLRKRLPRKLPKHRNDVYVNMKTDFRAQLARCQKLLEGGGHGEIRVHGLGLAINRAINIALQLQASSQGALQLAANTSTVELLDDMEPEDPDEAGEPMARSRNNSAIHIKVFYPDSQ
ncbi:ribonuclease P protein subunit p20 isoform X1 [Oncorhynchus tshawytscha]|uniref:ribonuclease P protein subunit p20 isoform X1 n=1 Tax=Oncorhynchus tshawytscha TaxID=74940 RepID=UPI000D0A8113|nr:ribonuclease P protein subunit p20 isoform X1 [Oncorhynchus tshawytscha]